MARQRMIKPDFWADEALIECSMSARLLFIGMWNFADDFGNLQRSAKKIKMQVFPADAIDCEPLINELITHGLLIAYSVSNDKYLNIKGFLKHQTINRPSSSSIPKPKFIDYSVSNQELISEQDMSTQPEEKRKEKNIYGDSDESKNPTPQKKSSNRGSRFDEGLALPESWRAYCVERRPDLNPESVFEDFREHWLSAPGQKGVKTDWSLTWQTWVRKQFTQKPAPSKTTATNIFEARHAGR